MDDFVRQVGEPVHPQSIMGRGWLLLTWAFQLNLLVLAALAAIDLNLLGAVGGVLLFFGFHWIRQNRPHWIKLKDEKR
ncbi:MAG: hypothetical protein AAFQ50_06120 [Pseudomonadota bacterium]